MSRPTNDYQQPLSTTSPKVIVVFLEASMTNPNGDPNDGGRPRILEVLDRGHITNGALKRKLRDYLLLTVDGEQHYVHPGKDLGDVQGEYTSAEDMTRNLRDLRYFGGTLTQKATKVRGPFVFEDALSLHPVNLMEIGLTRVAHHKDDAGKEGSNMGSRSVVEYGLYKFIIHFDPLAARQVGVSEKDMDLFWEALFECWEHTRSATRPALNLRRVYCFEYPRRRGGIPQHVVAGWAKATSDIPSEDYPTGFSDYDITVDTSHMTEGMTLHKWEDGVCSMVEK